MTLKIFIILYLFQIVMVAAYWITSTYINNKKPFDTAKQGKQWLIPFYLPFLRIKKGLKKFIAQMRINNG